MELFSLRHKIAVITGGSSGIGLATARRFVAAGAKVVIANRSDNADLAKSLMARGPFNCCFGTVGGDSDSIVAGARVTHLPDAIEPCACEGDG